ncbi:hypothetical protein Br6_04913 [Rhodococcus sp. Br-6]|nr:hypothetical protein Br6_04913 [Rhodococcus sp. Br-6]
MSTAVLDGPLRAVEIAPSGRRCDAVLDVFESEDSAARAEAVRMCATCPLLQACTQQTRSEILDDRGPVGVVRAGIAWDDDGLPDADLHPVRTRPSWIPKTLTSAGPLVDEYVVELAFSDPDRIRDLLTPDETDAIILEAAERGESLNGIRQILGIRWEAADTAARRLGIRDRFATKSSKETTEKLAPVEVVADTETAAATTPATTPAAPESFDGEIEGQMAFDFPECTAAGASGAANSTTPAAITHAEPADATDAEPADATEFSTFSSIIAELPKQAREARPSLRRRAARRLGPASSYLGICGGRRPSVPRLSGAPPGQRTRPGAGAAARTRGHAASFRAPPSAGIPAAVHPARSVWPFRDLWTRDGP